MSDELDDVADEDIGPLPGEDTSVDAGSRAAVRRRETKAKREQRENEAFLSRCLTDPIGRRFFWGVLSAAHTFETQFAASPTGFPDPNATFFQAGRKAIGEQIHLTLLRADPALTLLMMQEHDPRLPKQRTESPTDA